MVPAYIPQIGTLLRQGLHYDMATSESVQHTNETTRHPIEDPSRSFLYDHNREEPTELSLSLIVSTNPLVTGAALRDRDGGGFTQTANVRGGTDRISRLQDTLLSMRAAQSVSTDSFFDVFTGLRVYRNMGIQSLTFRRDFDSPNTLEVDMSLVEFRFALPPRAESKSFLMQGNEGPRNAANALVVFPEDRPIVEARKIRASPRLFEPTDANLSTIRASIRRLSPATRLDLNIDILAGGTSSDTLAVLGVDTSPSQQYTLRIDGDDHDLMFDYNSIADRWSFGVGLSGADCPKVAGRFVQPGRNLLAGISATQMIIPLDRPGIATAGTDWYARLSQNLSDDLPSTLLVAGSNAAFNAQFRQRSSVPC